MDDTDDDGFDAEPMKRPPVAELVRLEADELHEVLAWIQCGDDDREVIAAIAARLEPGDVLTAVAVGESAAGRELAAPVLDGTRIDVPRTGTDSDAYVLILSLAELLKERYVFYVLDSDDAYTRGFLIVRVDEAAELARTHRKWLDRHFSTLTWGLDGFSGVDVPWLGHEDAAPDFAAKRAAADAALARSRAEGRAFVDAAVADIEAVRRGELAPGQSHLAIKQRQEWAGWAYLATTLASAIATLAGAGPTTFGTGWPAVLVFAAACTWHARLATKMRSAWKPPHWQRPLPLVAIVVLVFAAPSLLRAAT